MVEQNIDNFTLIKYDSINEFYKYICDTPFNEAFRWARHSSVEGASYFTKTKNFEEAVDLLKNGWSDMAQQLTKKLKVETTNEFVGTKRKNIYDVVGYQASVPRYLQGVPNSMVRSINIPVKNKVVTLIKSIDYACSVSIDTIVEESIKAMRIIKKLEAQGLKINLDIAFGTKAGGSNFIGRIRVKNANERLNVSKLAFPLVHPSMLRRLIFRWIEVYPKITKSFVNGYGRPIQTSDLQAIAKEKEYILPAIIYTDINSIKSLDDLKVIQ